MTPAVSPAVKNPSALIVLSPFNALVLTGVGHAGLPDTCPLCEHHPLRQDDCKENVPLRKTIQVFLRHAADKAATAAIQVSFPRVLSCAKLTWFRPRKSYEVEEARRTTAQRRKVHGLQVLLLRQLKGMPLL